MCWLQTLRLLRIVLAILAASMAPARSVIAAGPSDASGEPSGPPSANDVSRKLKLLENFTQAPATRMRVEESGDPEALEHFQAAQLAWNEAVQAFEAGDLESASERIGTGYQQMSRALRRSKESARDLQKEAARYDELRKRVFSFSDSFQRVVKEKQDRGIPKLLDQDRMSQLLIEADSHASNERYSEAIVLMEKAAALVEQALSAARDKETLVQELRFASLDDEYEYEVRRNESYQLLVNLLGQDRTSSPSALQMMREVLQRNETTRDQAKAMYEGGDVQSAIAMLERSSQEISRILQISGLAF